MGRHTLERLAKVTPDLLVADGGRALDSSRWRGHVPSVADGPGVGPIAGILGAAQARPGRSLLVLACDLPGVPTALLELLAGSTADLAIPHGPEGFEPLCALYSPRALKALARSVEAGQMAVRGLAEKPGALSLDRLEGGRLEAFGDPRLLFANLNRPADLDDLDRSAKEMPLRGKSRS